MPDASPAPQRSVTPDHFLMPRPTLPQLFLLALILPSLAQARIGENQEQLQQRFGPPTSARAERIFVQGKIVTISIFSFRQDDWIVDVFMTQDRSTRETYNKPAEWTEEQISFVLTTNSQGKKWEETTAPSSANVSRNWKRPDGVTLGWVRGKGLTVTHPAYPQPTTQDAPTAPKPPAL